jgi:hypothetical protein
MEQLLKSWLLISNLQLSQEKLSFLELIQNTCLSKPRFERTCIYVRINAKNEKKWIYIFMCIISIRQVTKRFLLIMSMNMKSRRTVGNPKSHRSYLTVIVIIQCGNHIEIFSSCIR